MRRALSWWSIGLGTVGVTSAITSWLAPFLEPSLRAYIALILGAALVIAMIAGRAALMYPISRVRYLRDLNDPRRTTKVITHTPIDPTSVGAIALVGGGLLGALIGLSAAELWPLGLLVVGTAGLLMGLVLARDPPRAGLG
jgi:hypothetical protein